MKKIILTVTLMISILSLHAQVGINTDNSNPDASAMLDVKSIDKGILIPRLTTTQRTGINNPATGLLVFDSTTGSFWYYDSSAWEELRAGGSPHEIADTDGNTKVMVEKNSIADDTIRFEISGTEFAKMDGKTFHLSGPGGSQFIGKEAGKNDDGNNNGNTGLGDYALHANTNGFANLALGGNSLLNNVTGNSNTAVGPGTLTSNFSGVSNTAVGTIALSGSNGSGNTAVGGQSLFNVTTGNLNSAIGYYADVGTGNLTNATAIGAQAIVDASNKIQLGNSNVTAVATSGTITAAGFVGDGSGLTNLPMDIIGDTDNDTKIQVEETANENKIRFDVAGTEAMIIDSVGNVGIGTTTPSAKLEIHGDYNPLKIRAATPDIPTWVEFNNSETAGSLQRALIGLDGTGFSGTSNNQFSIGTWSPTPLQFFTEHQARMKIDVNGNVGIGTTTPSTKLDVNGTITATSFVGNGSGLTLDPATFIADADHDTRVRAGEDFVAFDVGGTGVMTVNNTYMDIGKTRLYLDGSAKFGSDNNAPPTNKYLHITGHSAGWASGIQLGLQVGGAFTGNEWRIESNYFGGNNDSTGLTIRHAYSTIPVMYLKRKNGNVGIGTSNPNFRLEVIGDAAKSSGGPFWTVLSDRRLKHNINDYKEGLREILQINPIRFQYNEKSGYDTQEKHIGVIAQDLQKIAPHMVNQFEKEGETYLNVDGSAMLYMFVNAFKEQQTQIEDLNKENEKLKAQNIAFEKRFAQLEAKFKFAKNE